MLTLLMLLSVSQGPLPPHLLPRADPRMILDGRVVDPEVRAAERRVRAVEPRVRRIHQCINQLLKDRDFQLPMGELRLILAVKNAVTPAAFLDDKKAQDRLREAVRQMRAGVSKDILDALADLDFPVVASDRAPESNPERNLTQPGAGGGQT